MTAEAQIIEAIVTRLRALLESLADTLDLTGPVPADEAAFARRGKIERVASTSLLKVVEQIGDQLARLFRTILQALAVDTSGLYAQDIANRMEQLGIVPDVDRWMSIIKLRNRLVHDYPIDAATQFARLREAHAVTPFLRDTTERAFAFLKNRTFP